MKMKLEHQKKLKELMDKVPDSTVKAAKKLIEEYAPITNKEKALRWELFWHGIEGTRLVYEIYAYLNDANVDTFLRKYTKNAVIEKLKHR